MNNESKVTVPVDSGEQCSLTPYEHNPLEMFEYRYKSGDRFVLEVGDSDVVHLIKGFNSDKGISFLVNTNGVEFNSEHCRPALPVEVSRRRKMSKEELDGGYLHKLLITTLGNAQHKRLLQRDIGDELQEILTSDKISPIRKMIFILRSIDNLIDNINARHIRFELKFAKEHNPTLYSDHNIACALPFYYAITRSMSSMGHSGFSHPVYSNLIDKILHTVLNKKLELFDWALLHDTEIEIVGEPKDWTLAVFETVLGPTGILRNVPSLSKVQLELLIELCAKGLRCHALTPLTLEADEWHDHGYTIQNKRNGEVFKKSKDSTPYYRGILLCDDTQSFRGFFSNGSCRLDLRPKAELLEYCVYLNYGFEVEPGTVPDGDLFQYAYIPPRIEATVGVTKIRKWTGEIFTFQGDDEEGNVYMTRAKDDSKSFVTQKEFFETGTIKGAPYPMWLALPEPLPIELLD